MQEMKHVMHNEIKRNFNILSVLASSYDDAEKEVSDSINKHRDFFVESIMFIIEAKDHSDLFVGNFWTTSNKDDYIYYGIGE